METSTLAIVGRDDKLEQVEAFLDGPLPGALLLEGEAGIGKTTVWDAAAEAAEARGFRVLRTRPAEAEAVLALAGVGDLLAGVREEALSELPPPQRRALEVALLLEDAGGKPPDQRAVATAFFAALQVLARDRPVAIAVDDVQWLDAPSRATLAYAARRLRDQALMFIVARRIEAGKPATEVEAAFDDNSSVAFRSARSASARCIGCCRSAAANRFRVHCSGASTSSPEVTRSTRSSSGAPLRTPTSCRRPSNTWFKSA